MDELDEMAEEFGLHELAVDDARHGHQRPKIEEYGDSLFAVLHTVEREKTPDEDSGYLWRLNAYWRFEQVGAGVLIECESVSLSRAAPSLLRPFISGVVEGVARESLERTLLSVRRALTAAAASTTGATRR